MPRAVTTPSKTLLTEGNHALILIDHQAQMAFAAQSADMVALRNNTALVARTAKVFGVSVILTTVAEKTFAGPIFPEVRDAFRELKAIDRSTMNAWEDRHVVETLNMLGHGKIVFAGLWTSVCVAMPVLCALEQGFEAYVIADACADVSQEAHDMAMRRMVTAGARPITALSYLLELQRDWSRDLTADACLRIAKDHGGTYGLGLAYAKAMRHEGH